MLFRSLVRMDSPSTQATWSCCGFLPYQCVQVAQTSAQSFLVFLRQLSQVVMRGHRVMRADTFCGHLRCARTTRAHNNAERFTANPERPARNSARTPRGRTQLLVSNRRGLLGFSGLAPHSGRSSVPFHQTCSGTEEFPSNQPSPTKRRPYYYGENTPDKTQSIKKLG